MILKFSLVISLVCYKDMDIEALVPASVSHHCLVFNMFCLILVAMFTTFAERVSHAYNTATVKTRQLHAVIEGCRLVMHRPIGGKQCIGGG